LKRGIIYWNTGMAATEGGTCADEQDVLLYYGATEYGKGPVALGSRSPRQSFNPEASDFLRERGSYQTPLEHP